MLSTKHSLGPLRRFFSHQHNISWTSRISLSRFNSGPVFFRACSSSENYGSGSDWKRSKKSDKRDSQRPWFKTAFSLLSAGIAVSGYITYCKIQTSHAVSRPTPQEAGDEEDEVISERKVKSTLEQSQSVYEDAKNKFHSKDDKNLDLAAAIAVSKDLCMRIKDETGSPGLSVAVFVNGREIWSDGFGFADLENRVHCSPDSVMRIASISKPIAMTIVARLLEEKKLDLDKDVREYVPEWPEKTYNGEKVTITMRQLVSHLSGIRHYDKDCGKKKKGKTSETKDSNDKNTGSTVKKNDTPVSDTVHKEFYSKQEFNSVISALEIFKNDNLCSKPGTEFLYTTHGWTLISAVIERAANKKFSRLVKELFQEIGMDNSHLDEHKPIIYNRARQYVKNKDGRIINAPYVDCSNKWAGGGLLSSARDVARFGNAMMYSYQATDTTLKPGYLQAHTMDQLWSPVDRANLNWRPDAKYGMGWEVASPGMQIQRGACREKRENYSHTGGAVGGASVLVIMPTNGNQPPPCGVVVAMIANMSSVGLMKTAMKIAKIFEDL